MKKTSPAVIKRLTTSAVHTATSVAGRYGAEERVGRPGLAIQNSADSRTDLTYQCFMPRDWLLGNVQAAAREQSDKNLPNRRVPSNSGCFFGLRVGYVYCPNGSLMTLIQPR